MIFNRNRKDFSFLLLILRCRESQQKKQINFDKSFFALGYSFRFSWHYHLPTTNYNSIQIQRQLWLSSVESGRNDEQNNSNRKMEINRIRSSIIVSISWRSSSTETNLSRFPSRLEVLHVLRFATAFLSEVLWESVVIGDRLTVRMCAHVNRYNRHSKWKESLVRFNKKMRHIVSQQLIRSWINCNLLPFRRQLMRGELGTDGKRIDTNVHCSFALQSI